MRVMALLALVMWSGMVMGADSRGYMDPKKCRYVVDPVVFHVDRKDEKVKYDICVGVTECDEDGEKMRYHVSSPALSPASCPTLREANRLNQELRSQKKMASTPNVDMRPDPEEILTETDGSRCEILDKPEAFWRRISDDKWTVNCFGTKTCTKGGKQIDTLFGCPPRPESEWEVQVDGRKRMFCSSLSLCMKEQFSFSESGASNPRSHVERNRLTDTTH